MSMDPGLLALFQLALLVATTGGAWAIMEQAQQRKGRSVWLAHFYGFLDCVVAFLLTVAMLGTWETISIVLFAIFLLVHLMMLQQPQAAKSPPVPTGAAVGAGTSQPPNVGILDTIQFTYRDAKGQVSHRIVQVYMVDGTYIDGFCMDRQADRTFRVDRIIGEVISESTGEVMEPREWIDRFNEPSVGKKTGGRKR